MELFHGSIVPVISPKLIYSGKGRDFGIAFYTTNLQSQAERWAWRHAKINRLNGQEDANAIITVYDFDVASVNGVLKWLDFPEANVDWLEMVLKCRSDANYIHGYDIVSGKIADDSVGRTISYVQQGIMRKEDALERLKYQIINTQIAFCTDIALRFLKYQRHYVISKEPL